MVKNVTNTAKALLEGAEVITEKTVDIAVTTLDILADEVSMSLEIAIQTRPQRLEIGVMEADYEVRKNRLKLEAKLGPLEKLEQKLREKKAEEAERKG